MLRLVSSTAKIPVFNKCKEPDRKREPGARKMESLIAATVIVILIIAARSRTRAEKKPFVFPDIGSPIGSAMIIYDARDISLDTRKIADIINRSSTGAAAKAEDVPLPQGGVFPLVRVTSPIAFVVVVNDTPDCVEEIREIANEAEEKHELPKELIEKLRRCNARLDVSSANNRTRVTNKAVIVEATTDLDPTNPAVQIVLQTLQDATNGLTFDCVNGGWLMR
jgi:hypothetical protein